MLNYRIEGEGPPLLLIHGYGVSFDVWQNLAPLLRPHFQLILLELPGVNASPLPPAGEPYYPACARAILQLRQYLGIERWSVLAYSAGTRACEAYLQCDAAHVASAVFLCPAMVPPLSAAIMRFLVWLNAHWPASTRWMVSGWRIRAVILLLAFNSRPSPYATAWSRQVDQQPMSIRIATLAELPGYGGAPLALPPLPTHTIWGRYDLIAPPLGQASPGDTVIPANHAAPVLAAPLVAEAVLDFLLQKRI